MQEHNQLNHSLSTAFYWALLMLYCICHFLLLAVSVCHFFEIASIKVLSSPVQSSQIPFHSFQICPILSSPYSLTCTVFAVLLFWAPSINDSTLIWSKDCDRNSDFQAWLGTKIHKLWWHHLSCISLYNRRTNLPC